MSDAFDAVIVGSGPAGVSAAFPLVDAGCSVLLIDAGERRRHDVPTEPFSKWRRGDQDQWARTVGDNFHALMNANAVSPKLRSPVHDYVFDGFAQLNKIDSPQFTAIGSLAEGGLSNAWGCGVARLGGQELADFPFPSVEIDRSYERVARRIGVSGGVSDDLSGYFGLDEWAQPPIEMDNLPALLLEKYNRLRYNASNSEILLGRSRVAALARPLGRRHACNLSGNCFWGCQEEALYAASLDLNTLRLRPNFTYMRGFVAERVLHESGRPTVVGRVGDSPRRISARKVILAAGAIASTRLVMASANIPGPLTMQSCPTAAFMLWVPRLLGSPQKDGFGLGQLSFSIALSEKIKGFGSLFATTSIPFSEFLRYVPMKRPLGIDVLRALLSSCVVGNLFLPGRLSEVTLRLGMGSELRIEGGYAPEVGDLMASAHRRLRRFFWKLGAVMLPGSFSVGQPGSDIHYSASLPMHARPIKGQTTPTGEVVGLTDVHIVDGACLPSLSEKSHTLTIMANADRISLGLAQELKANE